MKNKKNLLYGVLIFITVLIIAIITINVLGNENKLSSEERTWINDNINIVQNVNVSKDSNVFSKDGSGVFYTFLNDFSNEYGIQLNIVTVDDNSINTTSLSYTKKLNERMGI